VYLLVNEQITAAAPQLTVVKKPHCVA